MAFIDILEAGHHQLGPVVEVGEDLLLEDLVGQQTELLTNPGAAEDVLLGLGVDGKLQQLAGRGSCDLWRFQAEDLKLFAASHP